MHHGQLLKKYLAVNDLSAQELADKMDVHKGTIYNWIKTAKLDLVQLDQLKKAGVDLSVELALKLPDSAAAKPSRQIPIFELDVSASNIHLFQDGGEVISGYMSFPGFEDCDFGVYVRGDSMYPTYKNGYAIACKRINDMEIIQYGEPYLIITDEQRMVKRLQKGSAKDRLLCKSDNPSVYEDGKRKFEDFEIPRKKIIRLYLVKGEANRSQI